MTRDEMEALELARKHLDEWVERRRDEFWEAVLPKVAAMLEDGATKSAVKTFIRDEMRKVLEEFEEFAGTVVLPPSRTQ